jgi:hypothetical protein
VDRSSIAGFAHADAATRDGSLEKTVRFETPNGRALPRSRPLDELVMGPSLILATVVARGERLPAT